jgi:hypothetical protein
MRLSINQEFHMSKNAMAGAVALCGVGICMLGGAQLLQLGREAHAAVGTAPAVANAVATAASAQAGPTVVWYGTYGGNYGQYIGGAVFRAWSDGTIEMKKVEVFLASTSGNPCGATAPCTSPWIVINSPNAGYRAAADINADEQVNGADLASVLGNWGDAPRVPFPPSDCPLDLINP